MNNELEDQLKIEAKEDPTPYYPKTPIESIIPFYDENKKNHDWDNIDTGNGSEAEYNLDDIKGDYLDICGD